MAGVRFVIPSTIVNTLTSTITGVQLVAASSPRVRIERIRVSGQGILNTDKPVLVEILKQNSSGTASSLTLLKANDSDAEALLVTAQQTFTVEPTAGNIKAAQAIHPQSSYDFVFPPGRELYIKGGERLGIRFNSPAQNSTFVISGEGEE